MWKWFSPKYWRLGGDVLCICFLRSSPGLVMIVAAGFVCWGATSLVYHLPQNPDLGSSNWTLNPLVLSSLSRFPSSCSSPGCASQFWILLLTDPAAMAMELGLCASGGDAPNVAILELRADAIVETIAMVELQVRAGSGSIIKNLAWAFPLSCLFWRGDWLACCSWSRGVLWFWDGPIWVLRTLNTLIQRQLTVNPLVGCSSALLGRSSALLGCGFCVVLVLPVSLSSRASSDFLNWYEVQFDSH